jgi:hypothetical protein
MKPIMMSTEDVQAVLEGRKTQTRRVVKEDRRGEWAAVNGVRNNSEYGASVPCYLHRETAVDDISRNIMYPNYDVGDILWVRETWSPVQVLPKRYLYKADAENGGEGDGLPIRWRPSIHMPREAARLFLRVTDVRVERLQNISAEDCEAEGYFETAPVEPRPRSWFSEVWNARNAKRGYGWDSNPWVWVYTFERITKEEAEHGH